jgi:hypothetical protein
MNMKRAGSKPDKSGRNSKHAVKESKTSRHKRRLSLDPPLIRPVGRRIRLTNEQIYDLIELP